MRQVKFDWNLAVAEAVISASNPRLVAQYNGIIGKINAEIGEGVKTQDQADRVADIFGELQTFMQHVHNPERK